MPDPLRDRLQTSLGAAYTLERELGGGGMSRVFVAEETRFRRQVVIKLLSPELAAGVSAERFEREIGLAAGLQEPHIVPVLAAGDADGLPWYTMPYVAGESLRARIERGALPASEVISILRDVARALAYAHGRGVMHRDIKPENVLLHEGTAVVTDFGIAKALSASQTLTPAPAGTLTRIGTALGTPAYMAPEQAAADPATDHRADIYAWGVMAYELIAGRHPFADKTSPQHLMAAHFGETPRQLSETPGDVSQPVREVVMHCLAKDPDERPASASALISVLDQVVPSDRAPIAGDRQASTRIAARRATISGILVVAAGAWLMARGHGGGPAVTSALHAQKSLAVLPFESVGGDTANIYFAEGIADELTTALARVPGLHVAATSSAFTYRNKTADPREVGKALNVSTVLQGRVRRAGARLRVSAQLTNSADGLVLWSNSYEREVKDVFAVQDELTRDIVGALRVALVGGAVPSSKVGSTGTKNLEAYDLYLRGLSFLQRRGGGVARSITYFNQALGKDSSFARAWAQLGTAYALLPYYSLVGKDSVIQRARGAADIALRLDPNSAEAHAGSGMSYLLTNAWGAALTEFDRAISLDPDYTIPYRVSIPALYMLGRSDEAIERGGMAAKLDPLAPTTFAVYSVALLNGNLRVDALAAAQRAVELDSMNALAQSALAIAQYFGGHPELAGATQRRVSREPHTSLWIGFVRAATGDRAGAASLIRELEQERGRNVHAESALAWTYLGAGDTTHALDALERAARAREPMGFVAPFGHPAYDAVRQSARFARVIREFGLDPAPFTERGRR